MMQLARLPLSWCADAEGHWQWPWTLVNSIFPLTRSGVFGRISLVEITNADTNEHHDYLWFARPVSHKQFLSFAVPKIVFMEQHPHFRIISILPSSGEILAVVNTPKPVIFKFSPASNTWETLPPMISPPRAPTFPGVVIGDFFYVVGDRNSSVSRNVERLDLRSNKWEKIPAMKQPHICGKSFAMDGRLFLLHHQSFRSAAIFDPATNQWTFVDHFLPPNSKNFSVAVLKNELYMLSWSDLEQRIMRYDKSGGKWVFVDFVPAKDDRFYRKKRLCPVGNELWVMNCEHRGIWCGCDEVLCESSVWSVFKGPSFCPTQLENTTLQPQKFIHAYRVEGISEEPPWRTIPVFSLRI